MRIFETVEKTTVFFNVGGWGEGEKTACRLQNSRVTTGFHSW